jgi:hypothetical protein
MTTQRIQPVTNRFVVHNVMKAACIEWPASHQDLATRPMADRRPPSIYPAAFHLPKAQTGSTRRNADTIGLRHTDARRTDAPDPQTGFTTPRPDLAVSHPSYRA